MCDTNQHQVEDTILLEASPPPLWLMQHHPYDDECCIVRRPVDGRPELKVSYSWREVARHRDNVPRHSKPSDWATYEAALDEAIAAWISAHAGRSNG